MLANRLSKNESLISIIESWNIKDNPINSTDELLTWIREKNEGVFVNIEKISFQESTDWHYEKDELGIVNQNKSFFQIRGIKRIKEDEVIEEQPIIVQNEIGYLGIIGKMIGGVLYFLMQAKIEPGNINKIQISPTIQATKSNFMCAHGGKTPAYLDYFSRKNDYEIIVDQIQSEQSSRFKGKRNRNIIIIVDDDIEVLPTHKWMTLGQIKELMRYDNLVNMDTRTVISCIPFALRDFSYKELSYIRSLYRNESFFNSMFFGESGYEINRVFQYLNEYKMLDRSECIITDLYSLGTWDFREKEIASDKGNFKVIMSDIEIEGREVRKWQQPLMESVGYAIFGLIYRVRENKTEYLVHIISEIGCFDKIELGPTVQKEAMDTVRDDIERLFLKKIEKGQDVEFDHFFSEEGGRFYHEQNRNIIVRVGEQEISKLEDGYFWLDYQTLNILIQFNNCLNIQLRNLLSMMEL